MDAVLQPAIPQLPSGDLDITERFFTERLGFESVLKLPEQGFLSMKRGAAEIHFWRAPDEAYARRAAGDSSCYIRVQHITSLFEEFKKRQATFRYELKAMPWGMNEMQVDDPFGNAIRFGEA